MTYASTFYAVINAGLKPVLVDINSNDPLINFTEVKKKINKNTKVIIPVHLYGSVVDINELKKIVNKQNIFIIDDCAQAHGAYHLNNKRVGADNLSDLSTFSLYPGKNLGAYGDAGIITTGNSKFNDRIRKIRNIGASEKFNHELIGFNNRLDTLQAAILNHKIKELDLLNKKRVNISNKYLSKIFNPKIKFLDYSLNSVFHQFVVRVKDREKFTKYLTNKKIEFGLHYPHTINQMKYFKKNYGKMKFKNSENLARECVSLPIDPMLKNYEINYVIKTLNLF